MQRKEIKKYLINSSITLWSWNACKWLNVKDHGFIWQMVNYINFPIIHTYSLFIAILLSISLIRFSILFE